MSLKEKLLLLKELGVSYKFIAYLTDINQNTIYSYSSNQRNLSSEKIEKIEKYVNLLLSLKDYGRI